MFSGLCTCHSCGLLRSDLICVVCELWFCEQHILHCVQCSQSVCYDCYLDDSCCLVRPWGEKIELHMREFYQNKLFDLPSLANLLSLNLYGTLNGSIWIEIRKKAAARSVTYFIENQLLPQQKCYGGEVLFAECLPTRVLDDSFVSYLKMIGLHNARFFALILQHSLQREAIIEILEEFIRENEHILEALIWKAVMHLSGRQLFKILEKKNFLDFKKHKNRAKCANHLDAFRWIEASGGVDVLASRKVVSWTKLVCFTHNFF